MEFKDISDEQYREYTFVGGEKVRIEGIKLNVSDSGGHRIEDKYGISHYIPFKWIQLTWVPKEGKPNFAF